MFHEHQWTSCNIALSKACHHHSNWLVGAWTFVAFLFAAVILLCFGVSVITSLFWKVVVILLFLFICFNLASSAMYFLMIARWWLLIFFEVKSIQTTNRRSHKWMKHSTNWPNICKTALKTTKSTKRTLLTIFIALFLRFLHHNLTLSIFNIFQFIIKLFQFKWFFNHRRLRWSTIFSGTETLNFRLINVRLLRLVLFLIHYNWFGFNSKWLWIIWL